MNLSKNEAVILSLLTNRRETYGLEMVKNSEGRLKLGTIYVTLSRLEEKGFVTSEKEINATLVVPRRHYQITGSGLRIIQAWTAAIETYNSRLNGVENEHRLA
jgi:DNA-binding PadR family transcriptional regulator